MGIRTNRKGEHGALSYQEHKEYWRDKAKEWLAHPEKDMSHILYYGSLYRLKSEFKKMGLYELNRRIKNGCR